MNYSRERVITAPDVLIRSKTNVLVNASFRHMCPLVASFRTFCSLDHNTIHQPFERTHWLANS